MKLAIIDYGSGNLHSALKAFERAAGETQSKLSQLYDQIKAGGDSNGQLVPGETQSKLSQIYDQIRAVRRLQETTATG